MHLFFDPSSQSFTLGVVGSGAMGRGIAQLAAQAGVAVRLYDSNPAAVQAATDAIASSLAKLVERGKFTEAQKASTLAHLAPAQSISELSSCTLIIEAIVENLDAKRSLFAELEALVPDTAVLASNTSSLSVTAIAAGLKHPERFVGWHFFNPVPLMRVVEIVEGARTQKSVGDAMMALTKRLGHTAVRAKDTPGFIVNHAGRGFGTEALKIIGEGVCEFVDVDRIMREACGFRLGPFELMDLTGLDVSHPVMESIYHQYYEEPRFRPSVIAAQRYAAGLWGRKKGAGFYNYAEGTAPLLEEPAGSNWPGTVWISNRRPITESAIVDLLPSGCVRVTDPKLAELCITTPLGIDATNAAINEKLDPKKSIAVDPFTPFAKRRTLMTNPATTSEARDQAHALFSADGVSVTVIRDSAGFIAQRILAMIVNIACDIAQQRIATPADIDLAVTLGLNYPQGPLALGDALGTTDIVTILTAIQASSGDPRYRPSPWLARRALLGLSLTAEEH